LTLEKRTGRKEKTQTKIDALLQTRGKGGERLLTEDVGEEVEGGGRREKCGKKKASSVSALKWRTALLVD